MDYKAYLRIAITKNTTRKGNFYSYNKMQLPIYTNSSSYKLQYYTQAYNF